MYNPDVIIIDGKFFAHRFSNRQELHSEIDGEVIKTTIPYGCLTGLLAFYWRYKPKYGFVLAWDDNSNLLEKKEYFPEYKANRSSQNDSFYEQVELFKIIAKRRSIFIFFHCDIITVYDE